MRALRLLIGAGLVAAASLPAAAQPAGPGGAGAGRGSGGPEEAPGAYASPSAIPEGAVDERFGIPRAQGRHPLDPIELPDGMGRSFEPQLDLPALPAFAPQMLPNPTVVRPENALAFNARLEPDGAIIPDGLVWRLFSEEVNRDGRLQLMGVVRGGQAEFDVPPGRYILHVGYGRAGYTKRVESAGVRAQETVTLEAGGLRLNASAAPGAEPIRSDSLTFDIYRSDAAGREDGLVATGVPANVVQRLNAGAYHVVSRYGRTQASADIRVEAGRISNVELQHHAGELTMKLVRETGGEAIADTAWSFVSSQGDVIEGSKGPFSSMVLADGDWTIVAKNRDRVYQRDITVQAGMREEIEILTSEAPLVGDGSFGSGD